MMDTTLNYPVQLASSGGWLASSGKFSADHGHKGHAGGVPGERLLGKRVLIVEDEALLALELQFAFEDEGAEVLGPALSLMKALETVTHAREIDVAVLDVDLAGEDVYPIAELLLQRGVPFIFHTAHGSSNVLSGLFPGALTCTKPTLPDTLIAHMLRLAR
jgi:DNA-binding response OmpR family regulator